MRSKLVSSTPSRPKRQLLPPGSHPAWVPVLTAFDNELFYGTVSEINPFLPELLFLMMLHHHRNLKAHPKKKVEKVGLLSEGQHEVNIENLVWRSESGPRVLGLLQVGGSQQGTSERRHLYWEDWYKQEIMGDFHFPFHSKDEGSNSRACTS